MYIANQLQPKTFGTHGANTGVQQVRLVANLSPAVQQANSALLAEWPSLQRTLAADAQSPATFAVTVKPHPLRPGLCEIQVHMPDTSGLDTNARRRVTSAIAEHVNAFFGSQVTGSVVVDSNHPLDLIQVKVSSDEDRLKLDQALAGINVITSLVSQLGGGADRLAEVLRHPDAPQVAAAFLPKAGGGLPDVCLEKQHGGRLHVRLARPGGQRSLAASLVAMGLRELASSIAAQYAKLDPVIFRTCFKPLSASGQLDIHETVWLDIVEHQVILHSADAIECLDQQMERLLGATPVNLSLVWRLVDIYQTADRLKLCGIDKICARLTELAMQCARNGDPQLARQIIGRFPPEGVYACMETLRCATAGPTAFDPELALFVAAQYLDSVKRDRQLVYAPVAELLAATFEAAMLQGRADAAASCVAVLLQIVPTASNRHDYRALADRAVDSDSAQAAKRMLDRAQGLAGKFLGELTGLAMSQAKQGDLQPLVRLLGALASADMPLPTQVLSDCMEAWLSFAAGNSDVDPAPVFELARICSDRAREHTDVCHLPLAGILLSIFRAAMSRGDAERAAQAVEWVQALCGVVGKQANTTGDEGIAKQSAALDKALGVMLDQIDSHHLLPVVFEDKSRAKLEKEENFKFSLTPSSAGIVLSIDDPIGKPFIAAQHGALLLDYAAALVNADASPIMICTFVMPVLTFLMSRHSQLPPEVRSGLQRVCAQLQDALLQKMNSAPGATNAAAATLGLVRQLAELRLLACLVAGANDAAGGERVNAACWLLQNCNALFPSLPKDVVAAQIASALPDGVDPATVAVDAAAARRTLRAASARIALELSGLVYQQKARGAVDPGLLSCYSTLVGEDHLAWIEDTLQAALRGGTDDTTKRALEETVKALLDRLSPTNADATRALRLLGLAIDKLVELARGSGSSSEVSAWAAALLDRMGEHCLKLGQPQAVAWCTLATIQLAMSATRPHWRVVHAKLMECARQAGVEPDERLHRVLSEAIERLAAQGNMGPAWDLFSLRQSLLRRNPASPPVRISIDCMQRLAQTFAGSMTSRIDALDALRALLAELHAIDPALARSVFAEFHANGVFRRSPALTCAGYLSLALAEWRNGQVGDALALYAAAIADLPTDQFESAQVQPLLDECKAALGQM